MAVVRWGFESGNNGDALDSINSTGDTIIATAGTATISTAQKMHGTRSALFTGSSANGTLYFTKGLTATSQLGVDAYIYVTSAPTSEVGFIWIGDGTTRQVHLAITNTMLLRIRDGGGSGGASVWTSGSAIPLNTWVRISILCTPGTTTGTVRAAFYLGDSTTAQVDSGVLTNQNTGANPYTMLRIGVKPSTTTVATTAYMDDWGYDISATALLPPYGAAQPTIGTPVIDYQMAYIDMSATTFPVGPGEFSAVPSTGTFPTPTGILVPRDDGGAVINYTITATDTASGANASIGVAVDGQTPFIRGQSESMVWNGSNWV